MELIRGGRIATIDGLRGIAIVLVVWFHVWQISWQGVVIPVVNVSLQPLAETGFLGVALFFFISGFVLAVPYADARFVGGAPPTVRHFFTRRFLKIVPSYVLCIAVLIAVGYQSYPTFAAGARDVVYHLLFVHDWFGVSYAGIDGVMWSLGDEVQFYALFPLLILAFVRRPFAIALAMMGIANAWRIWCHFADPYWIELRLAALPAYLDDFAAGMLCAWCYVAIATRRPDLAARRRLFTALALAGAAGYWLIASVCYHQRFQHGWPHLWDVEWRTALAATFFCAALGSLFAVRPLQLALANPALLFMAAISYNLYLWHQPIALALVGRHIPPWTGSDQHADPRWMLSFAFVAVPAAIAVSAAITYAFERPILRLRLGARRKPAPSASLPATPAS
ncbi:MAG TPA: acyltransferase [Candidatus Baltobacteraceae bacterium]|nr:acyltransferase [Candidatus Baltobacteraceae bacterium]